MAGSPNEAARLAKLDLYAILDTPAEQGFDDIVRIASQICGTRMALISLIDDRRQWFKAAIGLEASETPRDIAFCDHAIRQHGVFEVADAAQDSRFADNPLVTGDIGLRFYAGAPLITQDGHALGTLCVLDRVPHSLSVEQQEALQALARQVMAQLELRRALARHVADEQHRQLLIDEIRHRSRNTLAVVQAIVGQSLRGVAGTDAARRAIGERLSGMADAHDLLAQSNWLAAPIGTVVATAARAVSGDTQRIVAAGPDLELLPRAALALSMALHELSTNAAKYGALSSDHGTVDVRWTIGGGSLELVWQESGGPPVAPPTRRGFGSQLTTMILPSQLGGTASLEYLPDGLRWTLRTTVTEISVRTPG